MPLLGELLWSSSDPVYTPIQLRPAKDATFGVNVTQISSSGSPSLAIDVQHKNVTDDSWSTAGSFTAITATGSYTLAVTGMKEQIRLKLTMSGTNTLARAFIVPPAF